MSTGALVTASWATFTNPNVANPSFVTLATDGTYIFALTYGNQQILKITLSNPTIVSTISTSVGYSLAVYGGYLYSIGTSNAILNRTNISTGVTTTLFNNLTYIASEAIAGLATDGTYLYLSQCNAGRIDQIVLSSSTVNSAWISGLSIPEGMIIIGGYLYVVNFSSRTISQLVIPVPVQAPPCFRIDTKILTNRGYRKIQHLRKGDLVKTIKHGFLPIDMIGTSEIQHRANEEETPRPMNRLYRLSREKYPELFEDLVITGCHSILVDEFSENQEQETQRVLGDIYLTDDYYRLPACVDRRAKLYEVDGTHRIYHIALENEYYHRNYGICANGLLVESCSRRYLKELSNMRLLG